MGHLKVKKIEVFARMLGYERGSKLGRLNKVDKNTGKLGNPSYEIVRDIANTFEEFNARWLLTGKGEMLKTGHLPNTVSENQAEYTKGYVEKEVFDKMMKMSDDIIKGKDERIKSLEKQLSEHCKNLEELMVKQINMMDDLTKGHQRKGGLAQSGT